MRCHAFASRFYLIDLLDLRSGRGSGGCRCAGVLSAEVGHAARSARTAASLVQLHHDRLALRLELLQETQRKMKEESECV